MENGDARDIDSASASTSVTSRGNGATTAKAALVETQNTQDEPQRAQSGGESKQARAEIKTADAKLTAKAQRTCRMADELLGHMAEVEQQMLAFEKYISREQDQDKPLYQWEKYHGYRAISQAIRALQQAADKLQTVHLREEFANIYRRRARQFSTSVSHSAASAMSIMAQVSATCVDEIEQSNMSTEGKDNAKTLILGEVAKVIKHCTEATGCVWDTLDMLEDRLLVENCGKDSKGFALTKLTTVMEPSRHALRKGWFWSVATTAFSAALSAAIGLVAAHLYGSAAFGPMLTSAVGGNVMYAQVMDLVQGAQAISNLTGEIYNVKLQDLHQCFEELAIASESHGLRIDNLVEALGPPNDKGVYYTSSTRPGREIPADVSQYIQKIADDQTRQSQRHQYEMEQMRKNINRMDIRLTKRVDKVDRYGM